METHGHSKNMIWNGGFSRIFHIYVGLLEANPVKCLVIWQFAVEIMESVHVDW